MTEENVAGRKDLFVAKRQLRSDNTWEYQLKADKTSEKLYGDDRWFPEADLMEP